MDGSRLRRFLRTWVRPRTPDGVTIPITARQVLLATVGFALLEWIYFSFYLPFSSIPDTHVFVLAICAWASPWIVWALVAVIIPPRRANKLASRLFILTGAIGLTIFAVPPGNKFWDSVLGAWMPGLFNGLVVGGVVALTWKWQRGRHARGG